MTAWLIASLIASWYPLPLFGIKVFKIKLLGPDLGNLAFGRGGTG